MYLCQEKLPKVQRCSDTWPIALIILLLFMLLHVNNNNNDNNNNNNNNMILSTLFNLIKPISRLQRNPLVLTGD